MSGASFQSRIDTKLGQVGRKIGQPYAVYRVNSSANGDFPGGWANVGTANAHHLRKPPAKTDVGVEKSDLLFSFFVNASAFLLGDVFICTDAPLNPGVSYGAGATILPSTLQMNGMALAFHTTMAIPVAARIDRRCKIYRPATAPMTLGDGSLYWEATLDNDLPLILTAGTYAFGAAGAGGASFVPVGMVSTARRSDYPLDKDPGIVRSMAWIAYLPPLPGYQPSEGDALVTEDDARYVMLGSYTQEAGVVGSQITLDRKISQTDPPFITDETGSNVLTSDDGSAPLTP